MTSSNFLRTCALSENSNKAHARRDYADALKVLKDEDKEYASETVAHKVLAQIAAIYKAEGAKSATDRYLGRQKDVKPLVEADFAWVRK